MSENDKVQQTIRRTDSTVRKIFEEAFKAQGAHTIDKHYKQYLANGRIPLEVERHCDEKQARWRV